MQDLCECNGTGLIWNSDNDSWEDCPRGCIPNGEQEIDEDADPLLNDTNLFPDELPEENKLKWEDNTDEI